MIKHVVSWKLVATEPSIKLAQSAKITAALEALAVLVPSVQSLKVGRNVAYLDTNWDLCLIAEFADIAGLEEYQVHPEHTRVAVDIKDYFASRSTVDFEV